MNCIEAKNNLLNLAIKHYQKSSKLYTFISLFNDEEPYPIEEVISILEKKCFLAEQEIKNRPKSPNMDVLETIYFVANKQLNLMKKARNRINRGK